MAIVATDNRNYTNIANAIRSKNSSSVTYKPEDMASAIAAIPSGTTINNQDKTVTPDEIIQLITKDSEIYTGLGTVTVNPIPSEYKDTSAATAVAQDIWLGKTAYNGNGEIVGTSVLQTGVVRPDAEKIKTLIFDKYWVEDLELALPAYSTTSQTLLAAAEMSETVTLDIDNYYYYICERALTIPTYNISTVAKGRTEYQFCSACYEIVHFPASSFASINGSTKTYTSRNTTVYAAGNCVRLIYWSSGTAVSVTASAAYGCSTTITAPTISSATAASPVLTLKTPALIMRGNSSYLSQTYWEAITDVRTQFVVDIYRVPKSNTLGIGGWGLGSQSEHILDCVNTTNHDLT